MKEIICSVTYCPKSNTVNSNRCNPPTDNYLLCGDLHRRQVYLLFLSFFDYEVSFITGLNTLCLVTSPNNYIQFSLWVYHV